MILTDVRSYKLINVIKKSEKENTLDVIIFLSGEMSLEAF
jgi:hypothetical protein